MYVLDKYIRELKKGLGGVKSCYLSKMLGVVETAGVIAYRLPY